MRVAVLGSHDVPTAPLFERALSNVGLDVTVILNAKREATADLARWIERTGGYFRPRQIEAPVTNVARVASDDGARLLSQFDLAVNGGVLEIIKAPALTAPRLGILNVHPGLLPKYRGCTAVEWALYNGDPVGVTAHIMDDGIDTGPIVAKREIEVTRCPDYRHVRIEVYSASFALAAEAARMLANGAKPEPQGEGTYWEPIPDDKLREVMARF